MPGKVLPQNKKYIYIAIVSIAVGALFRLFWLTDMEWKADEKLMLDLATTALRSDHLPLLGMPSGGGIMNAGFSIWPFALFIFIHPNPLSVAMLVAACNILALGILLFCATKYENPYRNYLLVGLASYAIAVLPVVFSRKIWAQDLLPLFVSLMWLLFIYRKKWPAVLLLGTISMLSGQLHLSGYFYAIGLFLSAVISKKFGKKEILLFCIGALIGLIPATSWMNEVAHGGNSIASFHNIYKFEFWLHALLDPLGINVRYSLGNDTTDFATFPSATYLTLLCAMGIVTIFVYSCIRKWHFRSTSLQSSLENPIYFLGISFILIPGLLLTLCGIPVRSHYLIAAYPFLHIVLMRIVGNKGIRTKVLFIALQACMTLLFLVYVHSKQVINGDYGTTYRQQISSQTSK